MAKFPNIIVDKVAHSRIRLSILSDSTYIDTIKNSIDAYSIAYNVKKRDVYDLIGILPQNISAELTGRRAIKGSHKSYMRVLCSTDDERDKFSEKYNSYAEAILLRNILNKNNDGEFALSYINNGDFDSTLFINDTVYCRDILNKIDKLRHTDNEFLGVHAAFSATNMLLDSRLGHRNMKNRPYLAVSAAHIASRSLDDPVKYRDNLNKIIAIVNDYELVSATLEADIMLGRIRADALDKFATKDSSTGEYFWHSNDIIQRVHELHTKASFADRNIKEDRYNIFTGNGPIGSTIDYILSGIYMQSIESAGLAKYYIDRAKEIDKEGFETVEWLLIDLEREAQLLLNTGNTDGAEYTLKEHAFIYITSGEKLPRRANEMRRLMNEIKDKRKGG